MSFRDVVQELRDLGPSATVSRAFWELRIRTGLMQQLGPSSAAVDVPPSDRWYSRAPFESPATVGPWLARIAGSDAEKLRTLALESLRGRILCFGRWPADFGDPIDWHRDPTTGRRWPDKKHWSRAIRAKDVGDIKITWEVARFPHAFWLARAAAVDSTIAGQCAEGLDTQIRGFREANPYGKGIHWGSGLEVAVRAMSWIFAASVFGALELWDGESLREVASGLIECATYIEDYFSFAQKSVPNDHLIGEAAALLMISILFPESRRSTIWRKISERVLSDEAGKQIYPDGAYLIYSHNYHRSVLQYYAWASRFMMHSGAPVPSAWKAAMQRSVGFLVAHMNPTDGSLPNAGSNDGGLPALLTTCGYPDFRPILETCSVIARNRRLWLEGPWDEEIVWLAGRTALGRPLDPPKFGSALFASSGYCILRSEDPSTFVSFRCGSVRSRFPQIDMLHADIWWRGQNLFVDGGTYMYNGPREWHDFFYRTASHNTITIDNADQMQHHRQFKVLYWTKAKLLKYDDRPSSRYVSGEHYGYKRLPGNCIHHRAILLIDNGLCIVHDLVTGQGNHKVRLHWQASDFPFSFDEPSSTMTLVTGHGEYRAVVRTIAGISAIASVAAGQTDPIGGWYSRYYGEKTAAPSLAIECQSGLPAGFLTFFGPGVPTITDDNGRWRVECDESTVTFTTGMNDVNLLDVVVLPR